ncbi:hypothetical protein [Furfurilactobacillus milii]|uniref:Uncharacterized protein n=1 Tax=Furfurilactobacillus rossiae TaxID=231049 RepID=A0A7C9MSD5_9LACO|nr:hypothetical protein [Furfurilactobacillus milii]MYV06223.1 hypothetical protein [Furfurilactobacillus milii]
MLEYIITEVKLKYPKLCGNNWGTKYPSNANAKQPFIHKIYRGNNDIAGFDCGTENGGKFAFEIFYDLDVVLHKKGFEADKLYFKAWHHGSQDKVENRLFLGENEEFKSVNIKTAGWDGWGYELTSLDDLSKKEDIQDLVKKIGDILRNFDESKKG